jgi:hypothetical protein
VIIKSHLCGIAVAFDRFDKNEGYKPEKKHNPYFEQFENNGRPQGSLYSQQKRKIADACEYMRGNATHKPIIFVATSPGYTNLANEKQLIKKLTHNLRNGYDCKNYVWVREATKMGFPHFHFVADMPDFDCLALSEYWSRLFSSQARNSIRLGTYPKNGKRQYYLKGKRMCWYLTKYLGKSIGTKEKSEMFKREFRTFAVSRELAKQSLPTEYESKMVRIGARSVQGMGGKKTVGIDVRVFQQVDQAGNVTSTLSEIEAQQTWNWRYTGFANTYKGFPKEWKLKN